MTARLPNVAATSAATAPARGATKASARSIPSRKIIVGSSGSSKGLRSRTKFHMRSI
jgi:hypothetical protein